MIQIYLTVDNKKLEPLKTLGADAMREVDTAIKQTGLFIVGIAKKKISHGSRTGRTYKRRTITHQASAPGEPPKSDTGRLVNSIRSDFSFLVAEVGSDVKYSGWLEEGTRKMEPRPWLQPSVDESSEQMDRFVEAAIKRALKI